MIWALLVVAVAVAAFVAVERIASTRLRRRMLRQVRESAAAFRATGQLPEHPRDRPSRVVVTDDGVEVSVRGRRPQRLEWSRLTEVAVRTTSTGPWGEDVYLLLGDDAGSGIVIPQDDAAEVLPRLQRLPGFDNREFIRASSSTDDELFVCWRRHRS